MSLLVSIDPGLRACGVAVFLRNAPTIDGATSFLTWAGLVKNPEKKLRGPMAWIGMAEFVRQEVGIQMVRLGKSSPISLFVTELMQVDGRRGRVDDLFQLYGVAMWVGHYLRPQRIAGYYPRQWKGSAPKEVVANRIQKILTPAEAANVQECAPSLRHNVLDGIGLGLFHLGRLPGPGSPGSRRAPPKGRRARARKGAPDRSL